MVLAKLGEIDEVAYLRYASVHRRFEDVTRFVDEIHALNQRAKHDEFQKELFPTEPGPIRPPPPVNLSRNSRKTKVEARGRV
jgi:hypothetical protein